METYNYLCTEFSWPGLLFGIFVNILSSFLFIFALLYFLKPKIHIVPLISRQKTPLNNSGETVHAFKIINKSLFGAYDVEIKANYFVIQQGDREIVNKIFEKIKLITDKYSYINRHRPFVKKYGDNCAQFFTLEDLSLGIQNGKYVQIQVTARHSLTGLSNIVKFQFIDSTYVKNGHFVTGNVDEIKMP
jgi:hypothetical protein